MQSKILQVFVAIVPLAVFFAGVLHVHPEAAAEFEKFFQASGQDVWQLGRQVLGR